tara:strand:- start:512 stop:979 length:468 start_codon:yes stop_codon:yes gene_type:complete
MPPKKKRSGRRGGKFKMLTRAVNDMVAINRVTLACFDPKSESCRTQIGKDGKYMMKYYQFRKSEDIEMMKQWVDKWDAAIMANNNAKATTKIKNIADMRQLDSYNTIKAARQRWYEEMERHVNSGGMTLRSGKRTGKVYDSIFSEEDDIKLKLKF